MIRIYIGYDSREPKSAEVCRKSIMRYNPTIEINELHIDDIPAYTRPWHKDGARYIDEVTDQPFSTEFAFTRFMVPYLNGYDGWAVFVDADFVFCGDVQDVMNYADDSFPVMCVQHDFLPIAEEKMDGQVQKPYFRKLWSAFTLWNCGHPMNKKLTPSSVNTKPGLWLHQFEWCDHNIGPLPEEWHWILGRDRPISPTTHYRHSTDIKAYHFTEGTPELPGYENCYKSELWKGYL